MLSPETELLCRTLIAEKAATATGVALAISEPVYFDGKADFAAQTGIVTDTATAAANEQALADLNCNFVMTGFGRFDYTPRGSLACPVMVITYDLTIFQEFRRGLEAQTNAHNRHVAAVLAVWQSFLGGHILRSEPLIRHQRLEQIGKTARNQTLDELPGVKGFYSILQVKVEVS